MSEEGLAATGRATELPSTPISGSIAACPYVQRAKFGLEGSVEAIWAASCNVKLVISKEKLRRNCVTRLTQTFSFLWRFRERGFQSTPFYHPRVSIHPLLLTLLTQKDCQISPFGFVHCFKFKLDLTRDADVGLKTILEATWLKWLLDVIRSFIYIHKYNVGANYFESKTSSKFTLASKHIPFASFYFSLFLRPFLVGVPGRMLLFSVVR